MKRRLALRVALTVAKAALIVAAGLVLGALVLAVLAFQVMSWPYRSTRAERGPRAAQWEAGVALVTAIVALVQGSRQRKEA